MLQSGLVATRTQRHRYIPRHPTGPAGDHVGKAARAEEADTPAGVLLAQQAQNPLGEVPAPHVNVLVQVVSVHVRNGDLVPVLLDASVDREVGCGAGGAGLGEAGGARRGEVGRGGVAAVMVLQHFRLIQVASAVLPGNKYYNHLLIASHRVYLARYSCIVAGSEWRITVQYQRSAAETKTPPLSDPQTSPHPIYSKLTPLH